jgi:hypothetical protein
MTSLKSQVSPRKLLVLSGLPEVSWERLWKLILVCEGKVDLCKCSTMNFVAQGQLYEWQQVQLSSSVLLRPKIFYHWVKWGWQVELYSALGISLRFLILCMMADVVRFEQCWVSRKMVIDLDKKCTGFHFLSCSNLINSWLLGLEILNRFLFPDDDRRWPLACLGVTGDLLGVQGGDCSNS